MAETTPAYGGRAIITFYPHKHYYVVSVPGVVNRLYQPGVTTIIGMKDKSGPLMPWAVNQMATRVKELVEAVPGDAVPKNILEILLDTAKDSWRDTKQEAADIGSLVHRVLEQAVLGTLDESRLPLTADALLAPELTPDMVDQANNAIRAGLRFFKKHKIRVLAAEQPRWSPTWGYIGTGDLIAEVDGSRDGLDFKSAKNIYPENFIQLAAYQQAWEEEFPDQPLERRHVVRVGKDGKLMHEVRDRTTFDQDFLTFRALLQVWKWHRANDTYYGPKDPITILGPLDQAIANAVKGAA